MGFIEFSSGDADYIFDGVNHALARRSEALFNSIDALVIETTLAPEFIPEGLAERECFVSLFGNRRLLQQLKRERTPVFSVDVGVDYQNGGPDLVIPSLRYFSYTLLYQFSKGRIPEHVQKYLGDFNHSEQDAAISGRSAISAEKIANHLVERVKRDKDVNGRRVRIGLIYGVCHVDLVEYLQCEPNRTEAIAHHQKLGFNGLVTKDLDILLQYEYVPLDGTNRSGGWKVKKENMGLFHDNKLKRLS